MNKRPKTRAFGMPYDKTHLSYNLIKEIQAQYESDGYDTVIYSVVYENHKKYAKLFIYNK